jgi:two-component system response regulator RegA
MTANAADTLLLVEDDAVFRAALGRALSHRGFHVVEVPEQLPRLTQARRSEPGNAVLDLRLPDGSGLDLLGELLRWPCAARRHPHSAGL